MIVLNEEDDQQAIQKLREDRAGVAGSSFQPTPIPSASTRLLDPRPIGEPDFEAPPAYPGTGYQTFPQPPPRPSPTSQDSLPPPASEGKRPETNTWRRFVKAVIVALILYALGTVLWALISGRRKSNPWDGMGWPEHPEGPVEVRECSTYYQLSDAKNMLVKPLPDAKEGLFFTTTGGQVAGSVHFVYEPSLREAEVTLLALDLQEDQQELIRRTKICVLQNGQTQGLGISTPKERLSSRALKVNITLALPYSSSSYGQRRHIQSLRTEAPNFIHTLNIPQDRYYVDKVSFMTTNEPIIAESIIADSVSFQTTNAFIGGEFYVHKLLSLRTTNGHIEPKIIARNDPRRTDDETKIVLISSNSPITGSLDLQSGAPNGKGGKFRVEAKTANNPIVLTNEQLSVDAQLTLDARCTNSLVNVVLAPAFEGTFDLSTTSNQAIVKKVNEADPAHRNRQRKLTVEQTTNKRTRGFVSWAKDGSQGNGAISIATTNAPVNLYV